MRLLETFLYVIDQEVHAQLLQEMNFCLHFNICYMYGTKCQLFVKVRGLVIVTWYFRGYFPVIAL